MNPNLWIKTINGSKAVDAETLRKIQSDNVSFLKSHYILRSKLTQIVKTDPPKTPFWYSSIKPSMWDLSIEWPVWDNGKQSAFNSFLTDTVFCLLNRALQYVNTMLHHSSVTPYLVISYDFGSLKATDPFHQALASLIMSCSFAAGPFNERQQLEMVTGNLAFRRGKKLNPTYTYTQKAANRCYHSLIQASAHITSCTCTIL